MKTIITVQHPQSQHHLSGMVGSWTDWDLTPLGIRQAQAIGEKLKVQCQEGPWIIYTSDLLRARRTAGIIGQALDVEPRTAVALREQNLGSAVGQSSAWFKANSRPERTVDDRFLPDAESRRELWERVRMFLRQLLEQPEERVILVSHGITLGALHALWLGLAPESMAQAGFSGSPGGVSLLRESADGRRLLCRFNDTSAIE